MAVDGTEPQSPQREVRMRPASTIAALVFSLVAIAHLLRLILQVEALVGGAMIPMWVSIGGFVVAGPLAVALWREAQSGSP